MAQNRLLSGLLRYLPTSLISYIRNKSGHQPIALKSNSLNGLPIELILSISDLLPPTDILCLSMCDHRLFMALHRQRKSLPRPIESTKVALLRRIERDLPHHFLCHCCLILHKFDGPEHFGLTGMQLMNKCRLPCVVNCWWEESGLQMQMHDLNLHTHYSLYFLHLQLAMRRFYHGPRCGITTESLSHIQIEEHAKSTTLFSIEAQICTEPVGLYLRIQDIMLAKDGRVDLFKLPQNWEPPRAFRICSHLRYSHIASLVDPLLPAHIQGASFSQLDGNCDKCNTDFLLEIREYCGHLALIITRWINLSSGLSPDDWFWKIRSRESYYGDGLALEQDMTWSPRVSYENLSGDWSREALLSRNLSYFKNKSYKRVMETTSWRPNSWFLQSPESRTENRRFT